MIYFLLGVWSSFQIIKYVFMVLCFNVVIYNFFNARIHAEFFIIVQVEYLLCSKNTSWIHKMKRNLIKSDIEQFIVKNMIHLFPIEPYLHGNSINCCTDFQQDSNLKLLHL